MCSDFLLNGRSFSMLLFGNSFLRFWYIFLPGMGSNRFVLPCRRLAGKQEKQGGENPNLDKENVTYCIWTRTAGIFGYRGADFF